MKSFFLYTVLASVMLTWSCKQETTAPEPEPPPPEVNPNSPNANHLIVAQKVSGDSTKGSSFYEIIDAGDGGFFFAGIANSYHIIGKLDQQGDELWTRRTGYRTRDISRIPNNSGHISNALVAVGGFDANNDGDVDEGKIIICNGTDGTLVGERTLSAVNRDVWLNTLVLDSNSPDSSVLVGFGGSRIGGTYYPWAIQLTILDGGTIAKREDTVFNSLPWVIYTAVVKNDDRSSPKFFIRGHRYLNDSTISNIVVFGLSDSLDVTWSQDIVHRTGFKTSGYAGSGLALAGGNLIIAGQTQFDKENDPPSGYWDAGLIASITKQGQVNWNKAVQITQYSEHYIDCFIQNNSIWVVGDCSNLMKTQSKRVFGYGLLSKIDHATGNVVSHMSLGDASYRGTLNSVIVRNNRAYCVGYANYRISGGGYQSWFAELDVSDPPPASLQVTHPEVNKTSDDDVTRREIQPGKE